MVDVGLKGIAKLEGAVVIARLLDCRSQAMALGISQVLNREARASDRVEAIAAAVSIAAPLLLPVMVFRRPIVSGLADGAVKG